MLQHSYFNREIFSRSFQKCMGCSQGAVRLPIPLYILLPIPAPIPYSLALPFISHSGSHSSHSPFFCIKFPPSDTPLWIYRLFWLQFFSSIPSSFVVVAS